MSPQQDNEKEFGLSQPNLNRSRDLDGAFIELVERIEIDLPEFQPMACIGPGITLIASGLLLVAGVVTVCAFQWR
jgi:hypothetical protein